MRKSLGISEQGIEVETRLGYCECLIDHRESCGTGVRLRAPRTVFTDAGLLLRVVVGLDDLIDDGVRFFVGECVRDDLALITKQQVSRPRRGEIRAHESERVGRHLLTVVSSCTGLQIEVTELPRHDGIRCAGEVENPYLAIVLAGKNPLATRHRPHHRD